MVRATKLTQKETQNTKLYPKLSDSITARQNSINQRGVAAKKQAALPTNS
jgi:hypothetical protein